MAVKMQFIGLLVFLAVAAFVLEFRILNSFHETEAMEMEAGKQYWEDVEFAVDGHTDEPLVLASDSEGTNARNQDPEDTHHGVDDRTRPWMVVHVGPPKTGTSTIQSALMRYAPDLAGLDNAVWLGSGSNRPACLEYNISDDRNYLSHDPHFDPTRSNNTPGGGGGETSYFSHYPMSNYVTGFRPKKKFVREVLTHHREGRNIIVSSEHFTSRQPPDDMMDKRFDGLFDYQFLRNGGEKAREYTEAEVTDDENEKGSEGKASDVTECDVLYPGRRLLPRTDRTIDESPTFGFDVSIVVTYRHFFQWSPSHYFQSELINKKNGHLSRIGYIENALSGLGEKYTSDDRLLSDWPEEDIDHRPDLDIIHGSLYSYLLWSSQPSLRNRVRVFDMHQQPLVRSGDHDVNNQTKPDIFREFVCQALPNAPQTCAMVSQGVTAKTVRVRKKSEDLVSSLVTGKLTDTEQLQLKFAAMERFGLKDTRKKNQKPLPFETPDPEESILGTRNSNSKLSANFERWVRMYPRPDRTDDEDDDDPGQICLGEESLRRLRNASWNILRHLEALVRTRNRDHQPFDHPFRLDAVDRPLLLSPPSRPAAGGDGDDDPPGVDEEAKWAPLKIVHDEMFDETVQSGAYCELDVDRLFADETFVREVFFYKSARTRRKERRKERKEKEGGVSRTRY